MLTIIQQPGNNFKSIVYIKAIFLCQQYQMDGLRNKTPYTLQIRSSTWLKDSHSLYDYESQKIDANLFSFPITSRAVSIYRKRESSTVVAFDQAQEQYNKTDLDQYQFLTRFQIKQCTNSSKLKLQFDHKKMPKLKKMSSERLNTDESNSACQNKQEDTYIVVKKVKDINNQQQGLKLSPGHTIKLGRVQYFVSESKENGVVTKAAKSGATTFNNKVFKVSETQLQNTSEPKNPCKICLDETQTADNFLFNPCLCTGSCGTVHIECLTKWIHVKVKKETIGGTIHFNFNKFQCQICKYELPMIIESKNQQKELLSIEKPEGNYLVLEGACEKTKSVMLIQNVPNEGIKLGRGHECQIRITDISVSRSHAYIKYIKDGFYLFDNKSKFGTLVKTQPMTLQLGKLSRAVQIGRTILTLFIQRDYPKEIRPEFPSKNRINQ